MKPNIIGTCIVHYLVDVKVLANEDTNVARAGKRGNICVGNNVSATMCPRLPVPLHVKELSLSLYIQCDSLCVKSFLNVNAPP